MLRGAQCFTCYIFVAVFLFLKANIFLKPCSAFKFPRSNDCLWTASFFRDVFWATTVPRRGEGEEIRKEGSNCGFVPDNIYWIPFLQAGLLQSFGVWTERLSTFWKITFRDALFHLWKSCQIKASKLFTCKISNMGHLLLFQAHLRVKIVKSWTSGPLKSRSHVPALSWPELQAVANAAGAPFQVRQTHVTSTIAVLVTKARRSKAHLHIWCITLSYHGKTINNI